MFAWWTKSPQRTSTPTLSQSQASTASSASFDQPSTASPRFPLPPQPQPLSPECAPTGPHQRQRSQSSDGPPGVDGDGRPTKRTKGLTGAALSTLSTALDAAIFTSAIGYSAYQLWKHPPGDEDVDLVLARSKANMARSQRRADDQQPPPPYEPLSRPSNSDRSRTGSPRRERPNPRPRHSHRPSATNVDRSQPQSSTSQTPAPAPAPAKDPFSSLDLLEHPTPQFVPFTAQSPERDATGQVVEEQPEELDSDEAEQDAEMDAFAERLKSLIELGTEALASRPTVASASPTRSLIVEENRPLPPPVSTPIPSRKGRRSSVVPGSSSALAQSASRATPSKLPVPTSPRQPRTPRMDDRFGRPAQESSSVRRHAKRESISGAIPVPVARHSSKLTTTAEFDTPPRSGTPGRHAARSSWGGAEFGRRAEDVDRSQLMERASSKSQGNWWQQQN